MPSTLNSQQLSKINHESILAFDKWNRMLQGFSSSLERYEFDILYFRIGNSGKSYDSGIALAAMVARTWVKWNMELKDAKAFVVVFPQRAGR